MIYNPTELIGRQFDDFDWQHRVAVEIYKNTTKDAIVDLDQVQKIACILHQNQELEELVKINANLQNENHGHIKGNREKDNYILAIQDVLKEILNYVDGKRKDKSEIRELLTAVIKK